MTTIRPSEHPASEDSAALPPVVVKLLKGVLKARAQVEAMTPLVEDCRRHTEVVAERRQWEIQRDALKPYFAQLKGQLLEQRLERLAADTAWTTAAAMCSAGATKPRSVPWKTSAIRWSGPCRRSPTRSTRRPNACNAWKSAS